MNGEKGRVLLFFSFGMPISECLSKPRVTITYSSKAKGIYREAPRKGVKRRIFPSVKSQLGLSLTACEADDSL